MPGAERLRDSNVLEGLVRAQKDSGRLYAAICATPYVFFEKKGFLDGKKATAHPAFSDGLKDVRCGNKIQSTLKAILRSAAVAACGY